MRRKGAQVRAAGVSDFAAAEDRMEFLLTLRRRGIMDPDVLRAMEEVPRAVFVGEGFAANMSWRRPLKLEDAKGSGYYVGLFGGEVSGDVLDGETYQRLGGGAEMGYHWVSDYTRAELTVGVGAAQAKENEITGNKLACSPTLFLNLNIALGY